MLGAIGYSAMLAWTPSLLLLAYLLIDLPEASENVRYPLYAPNDERQPRNCR